MATLILTAVGQALGAGAGGFFGLSGAGAILGKAAGAIAGSVVDKGLFGSSKLVEGSRLEDLSVQASNEGTSLPRVYGRVRLAGQIIWATRFEEEVSDENQGGKGGGSATVRSYAYYANFAVALCEGPIARLGRVWADGKPLDITGFTYRLYKGDETQMPDPLIEARQGSAPAYRGTAYVVFEHLPLESFGNRLPQLTFEVIRPVDPLESQIRAVTLIPGAGEFIYQPTKVSHRPVPGATEPLNRHTVLAATDWSAALDELQDLCPALESVSLVVAWFGDDLRAEHCTLRPKVEANEKPTSGASWQVSGLTRTEAETVSLIDGAPAFGGTPSDGSVIAAIRDLKQRGLEVMLYPFILMDVPAGNGLPDPYGGSEQAIYPWRGRIVPSGPPESAAAAFFGSASAADFTALADQVIFTGSQDWGYRRFILHLAHLAEAAGGVDAFLIGSEMRGLTQAGDGLGAYPFVSWLKALAEDVRTVLRPATKLSYAADWSEYAGHQPGNGDLRFPLDPLWSNEAIDFVGIDCYLPIADQRDGGDPDGNTDPYDLASLRQGITSGEYFDWYYESEAARRAGTRSPISDGAYGKPFVYRAKDIKGWWQNHHYERVAGVEAGSPTGWVPQSKPIWLTELGFPAVDKGANQPNVFVDPKSSESALPHFSSGQRDDLIQRRALEAHLSFWGKDHPDFAQGDNPVSAAYGGPMVVAERSHLWAYDARPFPAFPLYRDVWSDGENWRLGHWLNGRLGTVSLKGVLAALLVDHGIAPEDVRVEDLPGVLEGIAVAGPVSFRAVAEPLLDAFGGVANDAGALIRIERRKDRVIAALGAADLVDPETEAGKGADPVLSRTRSQESEVPSEVRMSAETALEDYRKRVVASRRLSGGSGGIETSPLPAVIASDLLQQAAEARLARLWDDRESMSFSLSPTRLDVEPGDCLSLAAAGPEVFDPPLVLRVEAIEDGSARKVQARRTGSIRQLSVTSTSLPSRSFRTAEPGTPHAVLLDLPPLTDADPDAPLRLAAFARPWPGSLGLFRSAEDSGFQEISDTDQPAVIGRLIAPLAAGPLDRFDRRNVVEVEIYGGLLQGRSEAAVLSGRNALAVRSRNGLFEILQFRDAVLTAARTYRLTTLLRGQRGSAPEMHAGAESDAEVILLNEDALPLVPLSRDQSQLAFSYRLVPSGKALDDETVLAFTHKATPVGARPLAPVHLQVRRGNGGLQLNWIRQTRRGGDSWEQEEVPLAEELEAYALDFLDGEGQVLRSVTTASPAYVYATADEITDYGAIGTGFTVSVCQISARFGRGSPLEETIHV